MGGLKVTSGKRCLRGPPLDRISPSRAREPPDGACSFRWWAPWALWAGAEAVMQGQAEDVGDSKEGVDWPTRAY